MIVFKKITWKNFLSTGDVPTTMNLNDKDLTLIIGENGAGKSTLLDAICWSLFNKTFRNINKAQIVNTINKKKLEVEIEFSKDGNEYKVIRGIKPDKFEIYKNDELLNQEAKSRDYQKILENQILGGVDYKTFTQVVILGSATFVPFMRLTSAQRAEVIEDIFDIRIFSTMKKILKEKIPASKSQLIQIENELLNFRTQAESQKNIITKYEQLNNDNMDLQIHNLNTAKNDIEKLRIEYDDNKEKYEVLEKEVNGLKEQKISIENENKKELEVFDTEIEKIKTEYRAVEFKIVELESECKSIISKIEKIDEEIKFYDVNDDCPTCQQNINPEFKKSKVDSLYNEKGLMVDGKDGCENSINDKKQKLVEIKEIQDIKEKERADKVIEHNEKIKTYQESLNVKEEEFKKYGDSDVVLSMAIKTNEEIVEKCEAEIKRLDQGNTNELNVEKQKLQDIKTQALARIEDKKVVENERYVQDVTARLLKDTGIKTSIIQEYLPHLNTLINKYLTMFESYILFDIDESFNESIKSRYRDNFSYTNFSEGEKLKIDIAVLFAFRDIAKMKNSISTNLLLLDEIFDSSLDSQSTTFLVELLKNLDGSNVFVISHKTDEIFDLFDKIIKFKKINDFSIMENQTDA